MVQQEGVWVTPVAVVEKTNREVLRLYKKGVCRQGDPHPQTKRLASS